MTLTAQRPEATARPVDHTGIPSTPTTILALDPERIPLRILRTNLTNGHRPVVEEHRSFTHLHEFQRYLAQWSDPSLVHLVAPGDALDPLGVLDWLDEQCYQVARFPLASSLYAKAHALASFHLPDTHRYAYVVATLAACRQNVQEVAQELYHGVLHTREDLSDLELQVSLLVATLTDTDAADPADFCICPF